MSRTAHLINTVLIAIVTLCGAQTAAAQVTSLGTTTSGPATDLTKGDGTVVSSAVRGAVAYDDKHDVFLHVWEDQGAVVGRFIGVDGVPRGIAFTISAPLVRNPRVVYSKGAADDVFCVLVNRDGSAGTSLTASFVRFSGTGPTGGTPVGTPTTLAASGAAAVFNPNTRRFLLAWNVATGVALQHFDGAGYSTDSVVTIAAEATPFSFVAVEGIRLAYDWQQRQYMMTDEEVRRNSPTQASTFTTDVARVLDESTRLQIGPTVTVGSNTFASLTGSDVAYLPEAGGFLTSFSAFSAPVTGKFVPTATPFAAGASYPLMSGSGHVESDAAIDYDALSRRALVVAQSGTLNSTTFYLGAALLDGSGQPTTGWTALRTSSSSFYRSPRVRATIDGQFVVSYLNGGNAVLERFSVPLASTPGPRFSNLSGHFDAPAAGATVGSSFLLGGWALDFGASTGTGVDAVHAWAYPANGSAPIFLGADQTFHPRADLASLYGPHFTGTGFDINVNGLANGTYTIVAYARSTVSGGFTQLDAVTVTVAPQPLLSLEAPTTGATVGTSFTVGGWAIDLSAPSGATGMDAVHVWAYPTSGAAPLFVGSDYGGSRPDVGAAFGASFTPSGFHLAVTSFPAGNYLLVVYAHDTVTGTFSIQRAVDVTVAAALPQPAMTIDGPAPNSTQTPPFTIQGWAIDLGATSGPGVDAVHVWAFNTNGSPAVFAGVAAYGTARPDVAAAYGASRFTNSGYTLSITSLPSGTYDLGVYARSTVSGSFNQARFVRVIVQ